MTKHLTGPSPSQKIKYANGAVRTAANKKRKIAKHLKEQAQKKLKLAKRLEAKGKLK